MRFSALTISVALFSSLSLALPIADKTCATNGNSAHYRRAFPKVGGLKSCKGLEDAHLVAALEHNGAAWMKELEATEKAPPAPPSDPKKFQELYSVSEKKEDLKEIDSNINENIAKHLGYTTSTKFNHIKLTTKDKKTPYMAAVSANGDTLINTYSYSNQDVGEKAQMAFEDIMTYVLAYNHDPAKFKAHDANVVPAAVKKIKHIARINIANEATQKVIEAIYKEEKWGLKQRSTLQLVKANSKLGEALIATNNGSLAPKILGTNMKTLKKGAISKIYIMKAPYTMVIELSHG